MYTEGEWKAIRHENGDWYVMLPDKTVLLIGDEANAQLICEAVNACSKLNPDNPLAVAQSITDLYEALEAFLNVRPGRFEQGKKALSKAEVK